MLNKKLMQIGEVAYVLGITRKTILDYEKYGLIRPTYVDATTSYRYYDFHVLSQLETILDLKKLNLSIKDIKNYLNNKLNIPDYIESLYQKIDYIKNMITLLEYLSLLPKTMTIPMITFLPPQYCLSHDIHALDIKESIKIYIEQYQEIIRKKIKIQKNIYHFCVFPIDILSDNFYETQDFQMKICFSVEPNQNIETEYYEKTKVISIVYYGDFEYGFYAYKKLKDFIKKIIIK